MAKKINKEKNQQPQPKKSGNILYKIIPAVVVLAVLVYLFLPNLFKKSEKDSEYMFRKDGELTFVDSTGSKPITKIDIQIADDDFDRELGLMFRKHMQENRGMLFIFPNETIQNFWMRNTFIPLDMIFVNSKDEIVTIRHATQTLSDQTYASTAPAQYVIEVNLDFTSKYDIKVGDKIKWARTKPQS